MSVGQHGSAPGAAPGLHIATIAYDGRIWDAYLEFDGDPHRPQSYRARIRFDAPDGEGDDTACTTVIIIEESYEEAVAKARGFDDRQLQGLLRSSLPDPNEPDRTRS